MHKHFLFCINYSHYIGLLILLLLYFQKCELCPSRYGALKKTNNEKWAHVVCALYIPEIRFGNVTTMEPILIHLVPQERYHKVSSQINRYFFVMMLKNVLCTKGC